MRYESVIWDVDGTLLDTKEGLVSAYRYTLEKLGLPLRPDEVLASYIGPTPQTVFIKHFGFDVDEAQRAADLFRERYKEYDLLKAKAYDGVYEVLCALDNMGIRQAIATNKRHDYATEICMHFGLDQYCTPIYGADNDNRLTKADLISKCLAELGSTHSVMIGDTKGDRDAAAQVGIDFIGVSYGYGLKSEDGCISSIRVLPELIMSRNIS